MTNWKPRRKQRQKTCTHISSLPYFGVKDGDNLCLIVDTYNMDLYYASKWADAFMKCFPKVGIALIPKDMCCGVTTITGKEYTVINNVLKRMKE